ncbi:hypothetical protein WME91_53450 [Sorangium sp. So ce269]
MPVFNDDVLPSTGALNVGSSTQRWSEAFLQKLNVAADAVFAGQLNEVHMLAPDGVETLGKKIKDTIVGLSSGGTIDCRAFTGQQHINETIVVTRPVRILLGAVEIKCSVSSAFEIRSSLWVEGMRGQTVIAAARDGRIFDGTQATEHVPFFRCEGLTLLRGRNGLKKDPEEAPQDPLLDPTTDTSQCFVTGDTFYPDLQFANGQYQFINNEIKEFGSYAIQLGRATYFVSLCFNHFMFNAGDIRWDRYSELAICSNNFQYSASNGEVYQNPVQSNPKIYAVGSSATLLHGNTFELIWTSSRGLAPTGPDIRIAPKVTPTGDQYSEDGYLWIRNNKFGGEGETVSRVKILVHTSADDPDTSADDAQAQLAAVNISIEGNTFIGKSGLQTAIRLRSALSHSSISNNFFSGFSTLVNDGQFPDELGERSNDNVFAGNRVYYVTSETPPPPPPTAFANGGRGFSLIEDTFASIDARQRWRPVSHEARELRNRLPDAEGLTGLPTGPWANVGTAVTVTPAGAGPTNARAFELKRNDAGTALSIFAAINRTALGKQVTVSFWAKGGRRPTWRSRFKSTSPRPPRRSRSTSSRPSSSPRAGSGTAIRSRGSTPAPRRRTSASTLPTRERRTRRCTSLRCRSRITTRLICPRGRRRRRSRRGSTRPTARGTGRPWTSPVGSASGARARSSGRSRSTPARCRRPRPWARTRRRSRSWMTSTT